MNKKLIFSVLFAFILIALVMQFVSATLSIAEYYYPASSVAVSGDFGSGGSGTYSYQIFTLGTTGNNSNMVLDNITLQLARSGSGAGLCTTDLYTNYAGKPGTLLAVSSVLDSSVISTSADYYNFTFDGTYTIHASTAYALVTNCTSGDGTNKLNVYGSNSGTYAGGTAGYTTNGGSTWNINAGQDLYFVVWGGYVLPPESVTLNSPLNNSILDTRATNLNWTTINYTGIVSQNKIYVNGIYQGSINNQSGTMNITETAVSDGDYNWSITAVIGGVDVNSSTWYYTIDTQSPTINITNPYPNNSVIPYQVANQNLQINWTATDPHLSSCWVEYGGTNHTVTCSANTTNINITSPSINNATFYANDTAGNLASLERTWGYKIFDYNNYVYSSPVSEASSISFSGEFYLDSGLSSAYFQYNNTNYSVSSSSLGGNNFLLSSSTTAPFVNSNQNITWFFWLNGMNTTAKIQTVNNLLIDDCSSYSNKFLTLNLADEENQSAINGTLEVDLSILDNNNYQAISSLYNSYNAYTKSFCSNINLSTSSNLLTVQVKYYVANYSTEFYNIQRAQISSYSSNITLYDIKSEDTVPFTVTYKNHDLVGVSGAIIQLQKKYVAEGVYKTVEAPLTSSSSSTVLHIDSNTNLYKAVVMKNGEILDTFDNLIFICQNQLTGECTLPLGQSVAPVNINNWEQAEDFSYSINTSSESISLTYIIPSNLAADVNVILQQTDLIGSSTVCNKSLSASGGEISCPYNSTIGNSQLTFSIYKNGNLILEKGYIASQNPTSDSGGNNYLIAIILILSLTGMAILSPEWIAANVIVSLVLVGGLWLVQGINLVQGLGLLGWAIVGAIIIIIKISHQEVT